VLRYVGETCAANALHLNRAESSGEYAEDHCAASTRNHSLPPIYFSHNGYIVYISYISYIENRHGFRLGSSATNRSRDTLTSGCGEDDLGAPRRVLANFHRARADVREMCSLVESMGGVGQLREAGDLSWTRERQTSK